MSTASFERSFIVKDPEAVASLNRDLQAPRSVAVAKRDYAEEDKKGIALLKQYFSGSQQQ